MHKRVVHIKLERLTFRRARHVSLLTADVDPFNKSNLKLLKTAGFIETGRAKASFTIDDRICNSVYLKYYFRRQ